MTDQTRARHSIYNALPAEVEDVDSWLNLTSGCAACARLYGADCAAPRRPSGSARSCANPKAALMRLELAEDWRREVASHF